MNEKHPSGIVLMGNLTETRTFAKDARNQRDNAIIIMDSYNIEDTIRYAKELADSAKPGDIICLDGDLGVGKTVFAQGFAKALGIEEPITSPTFTIMNIYDSGRLPLYHYDVYRIEDESEMDELGYEEYFFGNGVTLIEWACQIEDCIPETARHIEIKKVPEKGDNYREITVR